MAIRMAMMTMTMRSSMMVKAGVSLVDCLLLFINIVSYSISLPFLVIRLIYCYLDIVVLDLSSIEVLMYLCTYVLMYLCTYYEFSIRVMG